MNKDFQKYLSTAPVLMTAWLSVTTVFILFINFVYQTCYYFQILVKGGSDTTTYHLLPFITNFLTIY